MRNPLHRFRALPSSARLAVLLCAGAVALCLALPPAVFALWDGVLLGAPQPRAAAGQEDTLPDAGRENQTACLLYEAARLQMTDTSQWPDQPLEQADLADALPPLPRLGTGAVPAAVQRSAHPAHGRAKRRGVRQTAVPGAQRVQPQLGQVGGGGAQRGGLPGRVGGSLDKDGHDDLGAALAQGHAPDSDSGHGGPPSGTGICPYYSIFRPGGAGGRRLFPRQKNGKTPPGLPGQNRAAPGAHGCALYAAWVTSRPARGSCARPGQRGRPRR